jgi:hypothetical protein
MQNIVKRSLLFDLLLVAKGQPVQQWQLLAFPVLNDLQLPGDVSPFERRVLGLAAFGKENCEGVLIAVENKVLSDEFVDDEVLV